MKRRNSTEKELKIATEVKGAVRRWWSDWKNSSGSRAFRWWCCPSGGRARWTTTATGASWRARSPPFPRAGPASAGPWRSWPCAPTSWSGSWRTPPPDLHVKSRKQGRICILKLPNFDAAGDWPAAIGGRTWSQRRATTSCHRATRPWGTTAPSCGRQLASTPSSRRTTCLSASAEAESEFGCQSSFIRIGWSVL